LSDDVDTRRIVAVPAATGSAGASCSTRFAAPSDVSEQKSVKWRREATQWDTIRKAVSTPAWRGLEWQASSGSLEGLDRGSSGADSLKADPTKALAKEVSRLLRSTRGSKLAELDEAQVVSIQLQLADRVREALGYQKQLELTGEA